MKNIIIIGKGPAGISSAIYTCRAGYNTTILANGTGSLTTASKVENYYGFPTPLTGMELLNNGIKQAENLGVNFSNEEVIGIELNDESSEKKFLVKGSSNIYECDVVIIATGAPKNRPKIKGIDELDGKGVSYCAICDAFFYKNKNVAVLGNSLYALNEVNELLPLANKVSLLTNNLPLQVDFPKEVSIYTEPIESLESQSLNSLFPGLDNLSGVTFKNGDSISLDGLFVGYGTADSFTLAKKIGAFTENNRIVVDSNMKTNIPGLFAAGDCTGGLLQVTKAVSDGAIAGTSAIKYIRENL